MENIIPQNSGSIDLSTHSTKTPDTTPASKEALLAEIAKLGYSSMAEFCDTPTDVLIAELPMTEADRIITLQKQCNELLNWERDTTRTIVIESGSIPAAIDAIEKILTTDREHGLYQRGGTLVRVTPVTTLQHNKNMPMQTGNAVMIREIDHIFFTLLLSRICIFVKCGAQGDTRKIDCPERIARHF